MGQAKCQITEVSFSPFVGLAIIDEEKAIASCHKGGLIRVWSVETREQLRFLENIFDVIDVFLPLTDDFVLVASANSKKYKIYNMNTYELEETATIQSSPRIMKMNRERELFVVSDKTTDVYFEKGTSHIAIPFACGCGGK